jgi:hypothetical protein
LVTIAQKDQVLLYNVRAALTEEIQEALVLIRATNVQQECIVKEQDSRNLLDFVMEVTIVLVEPSPPRLSIILQEISAPQGFTVVKEQLRQTNVLRDFIQVRAGSPSAKCVLKAFIVMEIAQIDTWTVPKDTIVP